VSRALRLVAAVALVAALFGALLPALSLQLTGDDYQIAQQAHEGLYRPAALFSPIGQFIRPVTVWLFALDRVLWGTAPFGYHLVDLVLQTIAALCLVAAAVRLGLPEGIAWLAGAVWALSPFTMEVAVWSAIQHEQFLLIAWLLLIVAWPHPSEGWGRRRAVVVGVAIVLAMASKETWIVTPALVLALSWAVEEATRRRTVAVVGTSTALALLYTAGRFLAIPSTGGYYRLDPTLLAKVPRLLATVLWFEQPLPVPTTLSWRDGLATGAVVALAVFAWKRHRGAVTVGSALLLAPLVPVLFIPFSPLRYGHVPYAGFLLIVAAAVSAARATLPSRSRWLLGGAAAAVAALVAAAGVIEVRATLADWAVVSRAHARLLAQARAFAPDLPLDRPVVVARLEHENVLLEVATAPQGLPQLWYVRHDDPAGLIDAAALFDWVLDRPDVLVTEVGHWRTELKGVPGSVAGHTPGGFAWLATSTDNVAASGEALLARGHRLRVIRATSLSR
jgi:hypothetical protein